MTSLTEYLASIREPNFKRYKDLFLGKNELSILRTLQYEIIDGITFKGQVLDFGGGEKAKYRDFLKCDHYYSVNIDPNIEPTWVVGINEKLPCPKNNFDTVISFNTFEQ